METKQHATIKPMGQRWNQRGNQEIPWGKQQWTHNLKKKSMGCKKSNPKREVHSDTDLPQKSNKNFI